jgi:phosphorylase kinase alpha/beta subunit
LLLDSVFRGERSGIADYQAKLQAVLVERDGIGLLPELYVVPKEKVEAERKTPHSQPRLPNENVPLVWAQSLYFLGQMLSEGLLSVGDIDPLGRHLHVRQQRKPTVQIALLAEDEALQSRLATYGIDTQTPKQIEPIAVRRATELADAYTQIGRNDKLGLTGRPWRRLRGLTTSRIFRISGETVVFLPSLLDQQQFYLSLDPHFLVSQIRSEIAHIQRHWYQLGRPTMTLLLTHTMLKAEEDAIDKGLPILTLIKELQEGTCNGVQVKLGRLNQLMMTACTERMDFLYSFSFAEAPVQDASPTEVYLAFSPTRNFPLSITQEFKLESETNVVPLLKSLRQSDNLYEQYELLSSLARLHGFDFDTGLGQPARKVSVEDLLNEVYFKADSLKLWAILRGVAGLYDKMTINFADVVTDILVRQKQIAVGRAYSEDSLITRPMAPQEIMEKLREFCREDIRDRVLTQEILVYLSLLIKAEPALFDGLLTLRVGFLILLITAELAREFQLTQDEAYDRLLQLSPHDIQTRLYQVIKGYKTINRSFFQQESLRVSQQETAIDWEVQSDQSQGQIAKEKTAEDSGEHQTAGDHWLHKRQLDGALNRVPPNFYPSVWNLLKHCKGLVIGDKLERRNRLESEPLLAEMTPGEKNFALRVEHLLNKIQAPEYRQVNIETLMELAAFMERNPDLYIEETIALDVLIGHAVRLAWLDHYPEHGQRYDDYKAAAWRYFYESTPYDCAAYVVKALRFLITLAEFAKEKKPVFGGDSFEDETENLSSKRTKIH